jgi:AcrR family transcriptional regulator
MPDHAPGPGRAAQRRRTRKAIVEATSRLLGEGADPSVSDIAAAADVSRRTIYTYFPTLDQLLLDAAVGAMASTVDASLDAAGQDPRSRITTMITVLADEMGRTLPLGRTLIRLTVDAPAGNSGPKRGYRRVAWIEKALEPARPRLEPRRFEQLVSALSVIIGWEAFIVLSDIRGLDTAQARQIITDTALAVIDAALG